MYLYSRIFYIAFYSKLIRNIFLLYNAFYSKIICNAFL